jgi:hypothetical protein
MNNYNNWQEQSMPKRWTTPKIQHGSYPKAEDLHYRYCQRLVKNLVFKAEIVPMQCT